MSQAPRDPAASRRTAALRAAPSTLSAFLLAAHAAAGPAVDFEQAGSGCGPSNVEGYELEVLTGITVSALGAWDFQLDGLEHAIPVGLYDAACQLVASVTVPAGSEAPLRGQYRYASIAPVDLAPGTYRIGAVIQCDDFSPDLASLDDVTVDPSITVVQTRRIAFATELACPTEGGAQFSLAPNFLIGPPCGNGILDEGEACDDGDTDDGDCCSATCTIPADSCRAAARSQLLLKDDVRDEKDKLVWKWTKGEPTTREELADPTVASDYALCLYDASGLRLDAELPADPSAWSALREDGFKFKDPAGAHGGFTKASLVGSSASKSKASVQGKGAGLALPALGGLPLPVSLRLRNTETGLCLESVFDEADVTRNDAGLFKARAR